MNAPARVGAFALALAAVLGASAVAGNAWGPTLDSEAAGDAGHAMTGDSGSGTAAGPAGHGDEAGESDGHADDEAGHGDGGTAQETADHLPGGLMRSQDGLTLDLATDGARAGDAVPLSFRLRHDDGTPVTDYETVHGKQLHLIAVRRDLSGYQHVHPELDPATGRWRTTLDLTPGSWRVFTDFQATGAEQVTLGTDLAVPGPFEPAADPEPTRTDRVAGGYAVTLTGDLTAGAASDVRLSVSRDGEPVTDLQPYLGSYGHLVALREGDLAYLHVHPGEHGKPSPGPDIGFTAEVPSTGRYRLFLDFQHDDVVRTAEFTVEVTP